jgi:predicted RNase H-like HicB family nuclease
MDIPVLIEPVAGNGYRASGGAPFAVVVEGATPEEALARLKDAVERQVKAGAKIVSLRISESDHPWLPFAGMFQDHDPTIQRWLQIMQSQRK